MDMEICILAARIALSRTTRNRYEMHLFVMNLNDIQTNSLFIGDGHYPALPCLALPI